jgi:hypothetical protein
MRSAGKRAGFGDTRLLPELLRSRKTLGAMPFVLASWGKATHRRLLRIVKLIIGFSARDERAVKALRAPPYGEAL